MLQNGYINLNRIFYEIPDSSSAENEYYIQSLFRGKQTLWDALLKEHRVVILAEAGAGKTSELKHVAHKLKSEGKPSFFIRLEHVADDFENSFEQAGSYAEFVQWFNTWDEGWLFLDSVDEARFKDPKDFEKAVRMISAKLGPAMPRVHIYITSRPHAWRPYTDLKLCEMKFPFCKAAMTVSNIKLKDNNESEDSIPSISGIDNASRQCFLSDYTNGEPIFKIYSLSKLTKKQIGIFIRTKGVINTEAFLEEAERRDVWSFTTRPQDLDEMTAFWHANGRLGSPLELIDYSIERRLTERDQDRAETNPLSKEKARVGVRRIAVAAILMRVSLIRIPDGAGSTMRLDVSQVLPDWNARDCLALLSLPIFDGAIYGAVRFHHRSVKEYLAAKWFAEILDRKESLRKVENLFFGEIYGMQLIKPSMKPVLLWLVVLNEKMRDKAKKIEPEVIFECGDPSRLPIASRNEVLNAVCKKLAAFTASPSVKDSACAKRFASADIADVINNLIVEYRDNDEVVIFLLEMISQGGIKAALFEAKRIALNPKTGQYKRIVALGAVRASGPTPECMEVLDDLLTGFNSLDIRILSDLIDGFVKPSDASVKWILKAIPKSQDPEKYGSYGICYTLCEFIERLDLTNAVTLLDGLVHLIEEAPLIEINACPVSKKYSWLMKCCAILVEKLISSRHPAALGDHALSILIKIPAFQQCHGLGSSTINVNFPDLVRSWSELNFLLFWKESEQKFRNSNNDMKERLILHNGQITTYNSYWAFNAEDFNKVIENISQRKFLEDRLSALLLAFQLYNANNCPRVWLERLKKVASKENELDQALSNMLLAPVKPSIAEEWRRDIAARLEQQKLSEQTRQKHKANMKIIICEDIDKLSHCNADRLTDEQRYLLKVMQGYKKDFSQLALEEWPDLRREFGQVITDAFQVSARRCWKLCKPVLRSEGADEHKIPVEVILGLTGLAIESRESDNWPKGLQQEHIELACRYAFYELNVFPFWFKKLYDNFPLIVSALVLNEIEWELNTAVIERSCNYLISKISCGGKWMWDGIALQLAQKIHTEPKNARDLENILTILQGSSSISNKELASLASDKCKCSYARNHRAYWFAVWLGVDSEAAIEALSIYLENIEDTSLAAILAMEIVVILVGEKNASQVTRKAYITPENLKKLYLLMLQYIRNEEDIDIVNSGEGWHELRYDAQNARNRLFSMLSEIPKKNAYVAMIEISKLPHVKSSAAWVMYCAKRRAEIDSDNEIFSLNKATECIASLDFMPTTGKESFELVCSRLYDLKNDLEEGDSSIARLLSRVNEDESRKFIGNSLRERANGKYSTPQEEELADSKRPDIRLHGVGFDEPVSIEIKVADNWSGPGLFERLEFQLCKDYLRDERSCYGIFLLLNVGKKDNWEHPNEDKRVSFEEIVSALQEYWNTISTKYPNVEEIKVIGIDFTKRNKN